MKTTKTEASKTKKPAVRRKPAAETSASPEATPRRRPAAARRKKEPSTEQPHSGESVSAEAVRERAYFLYLERNGLGGDPVADWLDAERELTSQRG